jgi:uncharacterized protein YjbI with pentapeptide repeats
MLMPRKPALLLHLLNLVLKPIARQTKASSNLVGLPQHPLAHDREAWRVHWQALGQIWRTEPEIDRERQRELTKRRAIVPDIEQGIYPFKDIKLSRADVEWLLATHEEKTWQTGTNLTIRSGLDLRGASLRSIDLQRLPLAGLLAGLEPEEWHKASEEQREAAAIHLEGANLTLADLSQAQLKSAHLEGANLSKAHFEFASLRGAHLGGKTMPATYTGQHLESDHYMLRLPPANLQYATFNAGSTLEETDLGNEQEGYVRLVDVRWGGVNLATVNWIQVKMLGNEQEAYQDKTSDGKQKDKTTRLQEYHTAVRATRQLALALQAQGLNEEAARFAYRAQVLQKRVFWFQMTQHEVKLRQRVQALSAWLFSWFLFLLAGYGYRLWRSFLAYALVIIGFTMAYYLLGASFKPPLSLVNALGLSMTSFHGRGFFPGITQLNDPLTILASIEAFVGLVLEATFIATLTQRFFGK